MDDILQPGHADRRAFIKRAGIVAGTTVWATPTVQSLTSAAFAAGSPRVCTDIVGFKYEIDPKAFDTYPAGPDLPGGGNDCRPDACASPDHTVSPGPGPARSVNIPGIGAVVVSLTFDTVNDPHLATVTITSPAGSAVESGSVSVGTKTGQLPCTGPGSPNTNVQYVGGNATITIQTSGRGSGISNIIGCFCVAKVD